MRMTENRRVFLNITATYARSLYALVLGLLCGRWTLMALGETDFGLNGLVGGLTVFIAFFNGVLAGANGRFYAFSVGAAKVATDKNEALEECRRWFNTALSVHSVVPLVLIAIGYPVGVYAVEHWLTIPPERIHACPGRIQISDKEHIGKGLHRTAMRLFGRYGCHPAAELAPIR